MWIPARSLLYRSTSTKKDRVQRRYTISPRASSVPLNLYRDISHRQLVIRLRVSICRQERSQERKQGTDVEPRRFSFDFDERPFIVIWETTQACDLTCLHCRACAQPIRSSLELNTDEAKR